MKLVYATLLGVCKKWRGVKMTPQISREIKGLWEQVFGQSRAQT